MGFSDILKSLFGSKSDRDMKKLRPIVEKIKAAYPEVERLDNDGLRERTQQIRQHLRDAVQPQRDEIAKIKAEIETIDYDKREPLWERVDKLEKEILDVLEDKLNEAYKANEHPKKFFITENGRGVVDGGDLYNALLEDVMRVVQQATTEILKEALKMIGHDCGDCVKPIQPLHEDQREKLRKVLSEMGLL